MLAALTATAQTPGPDAVELLRRAFDLETTQQAIRAQYFYREHAERYRAGRDGKQGKLTFTRSYEWVYLEGQPFRKLVAMNEHPLKGKDAENEERRMRMTAAERREAGAQRDPRSHVIHLGDFNLTVILPIMEHKLLREETLDGRAAWVIQSEPRTGQVTTTPAEMRALCYGFTFWVDREDGALARQEYRIIRKGVEALPGSWTRLTFERHSPGLWFPKSQEGFYTASPPRRPNAWSQAHRFYDFKKFDASTTVTFETGRPDL